MLRTNRRRRLLPVNPLPEPAMPLDSPSIRALLTAAALPVDDLETARIQFWVSRDGSAIVGAIGLERYGDSALLRSLAVAPDHRGRGIGETLLARLEQSAKASGVGSLVLLTQTAEHFFAQRGYRVTGRASVPAAIQESAEFRSLCPASAVCMTKSIN